MRKMLFILFALLRVVAGAQQSNKDSLLIVVNQHRGDTAEVEALVRLSLEEQHWDSIAKHLEKGLSSARKVGYRKGEADCYLVYQRVYLRQGDFSRAIKANLDALAIYEEIKDYTGITSAHGMLQSLYREVGDYRKALHHAFIAFQTAKAHNIKGEFIFPGQRWAALLLAEIGQTYILMQKPDSALLYTQKSIAMKEQFNGAEWGFPVYLLATILNMKGQYKPALDTYRQALVLSVQNNNLHDTLQIFSGMSTLFKNAGQLDSSIHYAQIVAQGWGHHSEFKNLLEAVNNLAQAYKQKGNKDSALKYVELSHAIKDSLFSKEKDREVQRVAFDAKLKEEEMKSAQSRYKSKLQLYVALGSLLGLLCISAILWHHSRHQQNARVKVEQTLEKLQTTQAQLIQKEKMASLGELTAGIAHEIQNPLNFVNNFSETNQELIEELQLEAQHGNFNEVRTLATDIKANEQKITYHGKRADAIVKSMLQHARSSSGEKQPTDLNKLVEEHIRLAYHGYRAKAQSFNVNINSEYDSHVGQLNVIPQEIGRVLLNIFSNAFYAVSKKKEQLNGTFEPMVSVSTKKTDEQVFITVRDNGTGMAEKITEKIFQPFFTTKPTGEGTGLGLSLSYDIITKGHGGELSVKSKEGEGTEFLVLLPAI
jgi:signal transduction histidine kinase